MISRRTNFERAMVYLYLIMIFHFFIVITACNTSKTTSATPGLQQRMQLVMGSLPATKNQPPFNTQIIDSLEENSYKRYHIKFTVAENEILPALLYIPRNTIPAKLSPAMMVLHSTDPLGKMVLSGSSSKADRAYAVELAERGYVVIAPDYPSFGELKDYNFQQDRYLSGTMKGIFNHIRCIDFLQSLPEVDKNKIGVLGHSLGGHNALFVSVFDPRLKVTVSSCGWTLFDYYDAGETATKMWGGKMGPWAQERYMPLIKTKYALDADKVPFDFDQIIASIAPRAVFINAPLHDANFNVKGVKEGMKTIEKVYSSMKARQKLKVVYPDAQHDFPKAVRIEAYQFIDRILGHNPLPHNLHK